MAADTSVMKKTADSARKLINRAQDSLKGISGDAARTKAAEMSVKGIEMQKKAFDRALNALGRLQDQSAKQVHKMAKNVSWVPAEGKEAVDEWASMTTNSRKEFQASMDKSFDLLIKYFKRVAGGAAPAKKTAAKKAAPKKKATAKKKAGAK